MTYLRSLFVLVVAICSGSVLADGPKVGSYIIVDLDSNAEARVVIAKGNAGNFGVTGKLLLLESNNQYSEPKEEHALKGTISNKLTFKGEINFRGRTRAIDGHWDSATSSLVITNMPLLGKVRFLKGYGERGTEKPRANDPMNSVVDTWDWYFAKTGEPTRHGSVTFKNFIGHADIGTMEWTGGQKGTWKQIGRSVTLQWSHMGKVKDTMTLSADGKKLEGTNSAGWKVRGTR